MDNLHILSADNVRGTKKHGIGKSVCCLKCLVKGHYTASLGTKEAEPFKKCIKLFSVLSGVNTLLGGTENLNAVIVKELCKLDSCLSAEGNNNTYGLFNLDDVHYILIAKRLEVKSVCGVIVSTYGFGVVVYDNNIVAELLECPYAVN